MVETETEIETETETEIVTEIEIEVGKETEIGTVMPEIGDEIETEVEAAAGVRIDRGLLFCLIQQTYSVKYPTISQRERERGIIGKPNSVTTALQSQQAKLALEQARKERLEIIKNLTTTGGFYLT